LLINSRADMQDIKQAIQSRQYSNARAL
jgi:hypothetical protein